MKQAISDKKLDEINSIEQEINAKWGEISAKLYSQQAPENGNANFNPDDMVKDFMGGGTTQGDVQNADFEEVK